MKKYLAGFLIGVIVTVGMTAFADEIKSIVAEKATFDVYVNGERFESNNPIAVINGSTYLPLKDTGEALGVEVSWNAEDRRVEVGEVKTPTVETTPAAMPTSTIPPITLLTPKPVNTPLKESSSSNQIIQKTYNFRSDIIPKSDGFPMVTKDGEHYMLPGQFGQSNIIYDPPAIQLPEKDLVAITEDNSLKYEGKTFVKLSSVGLKARIEGNTVFIEWAD